MSEKKHLLIKELLPLYMDDAVNSEAKKIIKEHLNSCEACRRELSELQSGEFYTSTSDQDKGSVEEKKQPVFIKRLKRLGLILGGLAVAVMFVSVAGSWILGHETAEEEQLEEDQELVQIDDDLESLSPPREAIMAKSGVKIDIVEKKFMSEESIFKYRYTWDHPMIDYVKEDIYWPNHLVAMDLTNNHVLHRKENEGSVAHEVNEESWILSGIEENTEIVGIEMPNLAVFYRPHPLQVPLNLQGETLIQKNITVNGIDFFIDKAEVTDERIFLHYRQLNEISKVGLYVLSFSLIDSNGKHWSKEPNIDFQIDEERLFNIPYYQGMQEPFTLHLEHAVLIVPGMHYKFSVK